jgi:predicted amidohydrolase YtcJ
VQSAAARMTSSGRVLNDPERIAVQEALSTVTANAARGAFEEHVKGTLEVGKLGDLVMLSANPLQEATHEIGKIPVAATVVGGEVVYQEAAIG